MHHERAYKCTYKRVCKCTYEQACQHTHKRACKCTYEQASKCTLELTPPAEPRYDPTQQYPPINSPCPPPIEPPHICKWSQVQYPSRLLFEALTVSLSVEPSICDDCVKSWKLAFATSLGTAVVCMCGRGGVKRGLNVLAHPSVRNAKLKEKKKN